MVAQDAWDLLAEEAPWDPENVQLARFCRTLSREGAGVMAGAATGVERAPVAPRARSRRAGDATIIFAESNMGELNAGIVVLAWGDKLFDVQ